MTQAPHPTIPRPNRELMILLAERRAGIRAYQLAAEARIHSSTLSNWAQGRQRPSPERAGRLANLLGTNPELLWPHLFPTRLSARRHLLGLTKLEVARRANLEPRRLEQIELGEACSRTEKEQVASALTGRVDDLFPENPLSSTATPGGNRDGQG